MKATMEKIDNNKVVFEIEVPQAEVAKAVEKAYRKLANKVNIPGFRKGKTPRNILERHIGKEALLDEAFELLASPAYATALEENNIEPVSHPEIDVVTLAEDKDLVFKVTVVAKPELTLGQYKGLKVAETVAEVTEEQIDAQIETMRNSHAKMVVAEGVAIAEGDFAIIDFEGFVDDVAFPGGAGKAHPLQIGSNSFIPGFETQLIGVKAGETVDVNVTFPTEYHAPDLAGKEAVFKVTVNDVKRQELPVLDDEFVKDVSDFDTVEELKADIKNKLEVAAAEKATHEFRNEAIKQAVENSTVEIPEIMVEDRITKMIEDLSANLESRGMKLEDYIKYMNTDMNAVRTNYRESALVAVKTDMLMEAIVRAEALEVTVEEIDAEIGVIAKGYGAELADVKSIITGQGKMSFVVDSILRKKAAQLIIDSVEKE
ncbi:trigger factor [Pelosinus sp. sgz500959]|uniref:trigger factor n=1 Tax=Pelosinus sp. sgz500959 TaxID=3242472 RepID=UPI0036734D32